MVGRFASVIGPATWGLVTDGLRWGRPAAVFILLVFIAIAFVILQGVDDRPARLGRAGRHLNDLMGPHCSERLPCLRYLGIIGMPAELPKGRRGIHVLG